MLFWDTGMSLCIGGICCEAPTRAKPPAPIGAGTTHPRVLRLRSGQARGRGQAPRATTRVAPTERLFLREGRVLCGLASCLKPASKKRSNRSSRCRPRGRRNSVRSALAGGSGRSSGFQEDPVRVQVLLGGGSAPALGLQGSRVVQAVDETGSTHA